MSSSTQQTNLFICMTPFHLFTTYLLEERNEGDVVILIDRTGTLEKFAEIAKALKFFESFYYFNLSNEGIYEKLFYMGAPFVKSPGRYSKFIEKTKNKIIESIYVFNDSALHVQFALYEIKHNKCIYIEDGSAPYNEHCLTHSLLKKILIKLFAPNFYCNIRVIGTSKYISSSIFSWPALVRVENKQKPLKLLELSEKRKGILVKSISYLRDKEIKSTSICLILLPRYNKVGELIEDVKKIMAKEGDDEFQVVLKKHPLDPPSLINENYTTIESSYPAEMIFFLYPEIKYIFGQKSTSLQTARIFLPTAKAYNICNGKVDGFDRKLENIGVINIFAQ